MILVDEPSVYRRLGLEALQRQHSLAPGLSNLIGIKATRAGLGVTARSMDLLGPEMWVLGESDGWPRLPDVTYHLWISQDALLSGGHGGHLTLGPSLLIQSRRTGSTTQKLGWAC